MQSVSSRIWTCVAVSTSYDDNHYTTGTTVAFLLIDANVEILMALYNWLRPILYQIWFLHNLLDMQYNPYDNPKKYAKTIFKKLIFISAKYTRILPFLVKR